MVKMDICPGRNTFRMQRHLRIFLTTLLFLLAAWTIHAGAQNLDIRILEKINPRYPDSRYWDRTSQSAYWVSGAASLGMLGAGLLSGDKKLQHNAYEMMAAIGISTLVSEGIKTAVNRARPADKYPTLIFVSSPIHGQSFPSGHSALAFTTAASLGFEYRKWYVTLPAYLWAGSVAYSRMYKGRHRPSEVVAGAALGIGSSYLSHWLRSRLIKPEK